jgi:hypothetical protein
MPCLDLKTVLSPCTVAAFLDEYFGRDFLHLPGSPEKFSALLSRSTIDAMLADPDLAARAHPLNGANAASGIVMEGVEEIHEPIALLSQDLERTLEAPVRVNLSAQSTAIPVRRLEQDEIILQIAGPSDCKIFAGPNPNAAELADQSPSWQGLLRNGDALYLPRGWSFEAAAGAERSVQLNFAIRNPTGADLMNWISGKINQHEAFRKDLPRFADPATRADYVTALRRVLARIFREPGLLERYRRETNLQAPARSASDLRWPADPSDTHLIAILTPRPLRIKRADADTILLVSMGKRLAFPQDAAPLLHYLCDRAPVSLSEFYRSFAGEFDREELSELLAALGNGGIIGLREPDSI